MLRFEKSRSVKIHNLTFFVMTPWILFGATNVFKNILLLHFVLKTENQYDSVKLHNIARKGIRF